MLHRPASRPVPGFAVKALYGEMAQIITGRGRYAGRLVELGYDFRQPELEPALQSTLDAQRDD